MSTLAERFEMARARLAATRGVKEVSLQSLEVKKENPDGPGLPKGYPSLIVNGKRKDLGQEMTLKAATILEVDPLWLSWGIGEMAIGSSPRIDPDRPAVLTAAISFARANNIPEPTIMAYCKSQPKDRFEGDHHLLAEEIYDEMKIFARLHPPQTGTDPRVTNAKQTLHLITSHGKKTK